MDITRILKEKVQKIDKPQFEVAKEMGYSPARLSGILNGRTPIYDTDIIKFCIYLECTPNDLIVLPEKAS